MVGGDFSGEVFVKVGKLCVKVLDGAFLEV
jgi:hypothetical protein